MILIGLGLCPLSSPVVSGLFIVYSYCSLLSRVSDSCTWTDHPTSVSVMRSHLLLKMHELSVSVRCVKMDSQTMTLKHTSVTRQQSSAAVIPLRVQPVSKCLILPSPSSEGSMDHPAMTALYLLFVVYNLVI